MQSSINRYSQHTKFYITLVVSLLSTSFFIAGLRFLNFLYKFIQCKLQENNYLYLHFIVLSLLNNYYQVYAHIFTATKFMGYNQIIPAGSRDDQSLMVFTMSNIFDILGWISVYIIYGFGHWFLILLAAVHFGSGITAILFNDTFQRYYIGEPGKHKFLNDTFGYKYWTWFRIIFVLIDAISRAYVSILITYEFIR